MTCMMADDWFACFWQNVETSSLTHRAPSNGVRRAEVKKIGKNWNGSNFTLRSIGKKWKIKNIEQMIIIWVFVSSAMSTICYDTLLHIPSSNCFFLDFTQPWTTGPQHLLQITTTWSNVTMQLKHGNVYRLIMYTGFHAPRQLHFKALHIALVLRTNNRTEQNTSLIYLAHFGFYKRNILLQRNLPLIIDNKWCIF